MQFIRRYRWAIIGVGALAVLIAFLAFRPDKIFVDDAVDESLSDAFVSSEVTPDTSTTTTESEPETAAGDAEASTTAIEPVPADSDPVALKAGEFEGVDHRAAGTATVYEQDGKFVLRFEDNTDIQNGPDLFIWLLPTDEYTGGIPTEYIDLGKIKGNVGGQNYELPADFDPDVDQLVLVWCKRFSTPFAAASLN
ncbi:MAG: DM13 domain-containing protein [Acidimicrobiia bacterium]|nr:MAG: DM13 domain-containing protein [Acidimicrobiia bacterium]